MYTDVIITDNSHWIVVWYEVVSLLLLFPLYLLSSRRFFIFRFKRGVNLLVIFALAGCQYHIARSYDNPIYNFFGYHLYDDAVMKCSAVFFFILYVCFAGDWNKILNPEKHKNSPPQE